MVLTVNRIKYLLERDRIGREKRGGHDYLDESDLEILAHLEDFGHRLATNQLPEAPFHLKHPEKKFPRDRPRKA